MQIEVRLSLPEGKENKLNNNFGQLFKTPNLLKNYKSYELKKKKKTRTPGNRHVLFMSAEYFWVIPLVLM